MTSRSAPWGRFDDLRSGTALLFTQPSRVLVATTAADVVPVLAEVDEAARRGSWAFGHVAYEAAAGLDGLPTAEPDPSGPPLAWFALTGEPARVPPVVPPPGRGFAAEPWQPGWTPEQHRRAVARVREHIAAGDTYQCNLTVRLRSWIAGCPEELYADLAGRQRSRYSAYLDLGRHVVASASPELFFERTGDRLRTRPMKGTAPRGATDSEDRARLDRLQSSAKERAENVIVVDLLRNDVGRIAVPGTVDVPELCVAESYPTVWQLVSEVTATVRPGTGLAEVFRALFPCGSVTGAPKRRTMEIVRDLEEGPRGVYCGAVGLVAPPDAPVQARFSVAIRTVVLDRATGAAVYGTGGGVTWDSDPHEEVAEAGVKAAILP